MTAQRPHDALVLAPIAAAKGVVTLPGSKSISNRALLLAALASGATKLVSLLDADDITHMRNGLVALGVVIETGPNHAEVTVHGCNGRFPNEAADLSLGNAGTAVRPLTAVLAIAGGDYTISGTPRMHERPIGDLVDPLIALGCDIGYLDKRGFPPLAIARGNARAGIPVAVRGEVSSQFLTGLLLALPLAQDADQHSTTVRLTTPLASRPYVDITLKLMRQFGVSVATPDADTFVVPAGARYASPGTLVVEGDASAASYFLAAGVIGGGPVRVSGVGRYSIQGDVEFAAVLQKLGADIRYGDDWIEARASGHLRGGEIDCTAIPDAAMTLAVVALFAKDPITLRGIGSWRVKETDRIAAMAAELARLGATVDAGPSHLRIFPPPALRAATIDTYDDHRMAMCFSLAALGGVAVTIRDPACVAKTFPEYFAVLEQITGCHAVYVHA